jgi:hypothetical protein
VEVVAVLLSQVVLVEQYQLEEMVVLVVVKQECLQVHLDLLVLLIL